MAEQCCDSEINDLLQQIANLTAKSKQLKSDYHELLIRNVQKDVEIIELKQKLQSKKYSDFSHIISEATLDKLRMMSGDSSKDKTFIFEILYDIYGTDLKNKIIGRSNEPNSIPRTTKNILEQLFNERIQTEGIETIDARREKLNRCIRNAIDRAIKTHKK